MCAGEAPQPSELAVSCCMAEDSAAPQGEVLLAQGHFCMWRCPLNLGKAVFQHSPEFKAAGAILRTPDSTFYLLQRVFRRE